MSQLIFGKYEIIRRLALGGMGEVFLARQTGLSGFDRLVILKSLLPELAEQEGFVDQFLDEARVAATLNHPNIVGIYEVGLWNGIYFIAMEHIHGEDLARLQKAAAKKRLGVPFQVSARLVHDALLGLDHAHHALDVNGEPLHIVHRDISPQNIMVRKDGVTKVVDFGIARAANRSTRTATGLLKGKLQYMPPEQIRGDKLDGRSDQFALGVVLWELCTGRRLFKGENELETLERVLKDPIPMPSSLVDGFPQELESVIMRMLSREAEQRYARCSDAAVELRLYLDSCSRVVGEAQVSEFVVQVLADELLARVSDLTPADEANFMISFGESGSESMREVPTPTVTRSIKTLRKRRKLGVAAASVLVTIIAVLGFAAYSFWGTQPNIQVSQIKERVVADILFEGGKRFLDIRAPSGAGIYIDDKEIAGIQTPAKVPISDLKTGMHRLRLRRTSGTLDQMFKIEPRVTTIRFKTVPPGASIWSPDGQMPLVRMTPGSTVQLSPQKEPYVLIAKLKGYPDVQFSLPVPEGGASIRDATVKFEKKSSTSRRPSVSRPSVSGAQRERTQDRPQPTSQSPVRRRAASGAKGMVTVQTIPASQVSIDGNPVGSTPVYKHELKPGKHTIRFVVKDHGSGPKPKIIHDVRRVITIEPGEYEKLGTIKLGK